MRIQNYKEEGVGGGDRQERENKNRTLINYAKHVPRVIRD